MASGHKESNALPIGTARRKRKSFRLGRTVHWAQDYKYTMLGHCRHRTAVLELDLVLELVSAEVPQVLFALLLYTALQTLPHHRHRHLHQTATESPQHN